MSPTTSPVYGLRKNPTLVDFPGRMAVVFFTTGCNFECGFCHNATLLGKQCEGYGWERLRHVCERFRNQWVDGAVITGGEPTLSSNLGELVTFLRDQGFSVKLDTNGSRPDVLAPLLPLLEYVAMDVKCSLPSYEDFVAFPDTEAIVQSVALLRAEAKDYEFRTTVLTDFHSDEEMHGIGDIVRPARRFVVQPFIPRDDLPSAKWCREPRTSPDRLKAVSELMKVYADEVVVRGA
ncbi:MAG: anaerobic ribonucleoside-triphosphate reductase activating protein [Lentisphaerae bacterium]|jgi:pyruvate formate lyase activating enzyme|nr:anaerobic ribonucleoside-triphosphate reductase activating protein [Lentisphaerota bacterium]MBT4814205.1 anaerobic ribonucleoside-triphosphate reductase activating protein [Lentisphaerota bacterium]MBT5607171.1 anaerobic ribonucleoside-triphosphate reductase activating protein [Lentisphaerota bacterium]MBT7059501.1 anaerobic ribonucleoside-triphosphate reductase activating protein [Lentisphaerota bacterium]MBT7840338.1 anaerobic ribonucleoside-triphosphate reductase activating protein [Lent